MAIARERLEAAGALRERELWGRAVSDAYHAILSAARAALSERDRSAKTHRDTWVTFSEEFVASGDIDVELARAARATQEAREGVDYAAARVSRRDSTCRSRHTTPGDQGWAAHRMQWRHNSTNGAANGGVVEVVHLACG
jgi:uncharacterized protein (UPF0332 family)